MRRTRVRKIIGLCIKSPNCHARFLAFLDKARNRGFVTAADPTLLAARVLRIWAAVLALTVGPNAFGTHPLQTEDTGTQGAGNTELENGLAWVRQDSSWFFSYQPQLSFGVATTADLILQPSWLVTSLANDTKTRGFGDTNLDGKWRFYGEAPWSFAVRAGLALPTSQHGQGEPHNEVGTHVLLATTYDAAPIMVHGNVAYVHNPTGGLQKTDSSRVSGAILWACTESWTLSAEAAVFSSVDSGNNAWRATMLVGAIYTVKPGDRKSVV